VSPPFGFFVVKQKPVVPELMCILFSCIFALAAFRVTHTPSNNPMIIGGIKYNHKFIQLLLLFYTMSIVYGFSSAVKRKTLTMMRYFALLFG